MKTFWPRIGNATSMRSKWHVHGSCRSTPTISSRSRCGRLAWGLAGALLGSAQGVIVAVDRVVGRLYAGDPHWFVGAYAEPWRTVAISMTILLSLAASMSAALARQRISRTRMLSTAAAMIAGLAICLELTTTVHFNDALGELYVHTLVYRRVRIQFRKSETGPCVRGDFGNPLVWRLDGKSIRPRLLPLPYDARILIQRLSSPSRGCERGNRGRA